MNVVQNNNSNKMEIKLFPDYIDFKIITYIIDYLLILNNNKKKTTTNNNDNSYSIKRYFKYTNEILTYSIISKKWFNMVSSIITNNLIDNKIINYWIKNNNLYYKKRNKYNNNNNNNKKESYKMKLMNGDHGDDGGIISGRSIINLFEKKNYYKEYYYEISLNYLQYYNYEWMENEIDINYLVVNDILYSDNSHFEFLESVKIKNLEIITELNETDDHPDYRSCFNSSFIGNDINSIKISGGFDHIEPKFLNYNNFLKFTKLHTLSIPLSFHMIISLIYNSQFPFDNNNNKCCPLKINNKFNLESIICDDWESMIETILNCKSLSNLTLTNSCNTGICTSLINDDDERKPRRMNFGYGPDLSGGTYDHTFYTDITKSYALQLITTGLNKLISKNNLYYLKLIDIDFIYDSNLFFSPFLSADTNNSIKTLVIKYSNYSEHWKNSIFNFIINNNFFSNNNNNIKHFKLTILDYNNDNNNNNNNNNNIKNYIIDPLFNTILNSSSNFNLYSLGLHLSINLFPIILNYLNLLIDSTTVTTSIYPKIKEFNLTLICSNINEFNENVLLNFKNNFNFEKNNNLISPIIINLEYNIKNK